ncbi:MAG: leucine-rich repeat domain-containing protein [Mycoplasmoidaceae bacterium]|nr:leucine-rich repeat domain-containing protein [Mycoplasmoidaceae bacterium]
MPEKAFNMVDKYNLRGLKKDYLNPEVLVKYGRVRLPDATTTIASSAFENVFKGDGIKVRLILNDGLSVINDKAFASCSGLFGNLVIPHTVTKIGSQAFASDANLQGALLLPGNATIASNAFTGTNLSKVTFSSNFGMVKNQYADNALQISTSIKVLDLSNADQVPVVTNA